MQQQHGRKALAVLRTLNIAAAWLRLPVPSRPGLCSTPFISRASKGYGGHHGGGFGGHGGFPGGGFPGGGQRGGVNHPDGNSAKTDHWRNSRWRVRSRRQADLTTIYTLVAEEL
jgi:hypothetical protein